MKKLLPLLISLCYLPAFAIHITGSEITYNSIGNNKYIIHLYTYWDCTNGFNPGTSQGISVTGCSNNMFVTLPQSPATPGDGIDVTKTCPGVYSNCSGGSVSGINMIEYVDTVTLVGACQDWVFGWETCCRGGNIINIADGTVAETSITAHLNNFSVASNNSAYFVDYQPLYACVNQLTSFNMNAADSDGDVLHYSIVDATGINNAPLVYNAPYSGIMPIPGASIDPNTGRLDINPTLLGSFIICVKVEEINSSGDTVGSITRDFQIHVTNCSNNGLTNNSGELSVSDVSGNASLQSPFVLQTCSGSSFSFVAHLLDPDLSDSIFVSTNLSSSPLLSGSSIAINYPTSNQENEADVTFNCNIPSGTNATSVYILLSERDNYCPFPAMKTIAYTIHITPQANAGIDQTICAGAYTALHTNNSDTLFSWYDISNNLIPVSSDFSCNPCQSPIIHPSVTTSYILQTNSNPLLCLSRDTITVTVVPDYTWSFSSGDTATICAGDPSQVTLTPSIAGSFNYSWLPNQGVTQAQTNHPLFNLSSLGTQTYTVNMTSAAGCTHTDTLTVVATGVPPFNLRSDTCMLVSSPVQSGINFGCQPYAGTCALVDNCSATNYTSNSVGSGTYTNAAYNWPTPYGNFYRSTRHQFLYRASDLLTAGIQAGNLNSIAFNVTNTNGIGQLPDYSIKLICTNLDSLTPAVNSVDFLQGGVEVYHNSSLTVTNGLNTHPFIQPYSWDGVSNLVVDICFDLSSPSYTNNASVSQTNTSYICALNAISDGNSTCPDPPVSANFISFDAYYSRPDAIFNYSVPFDTSLFHFSWLPITGVSNAMITNPTITPPVGTSTYTLTVSTLDGSCSRTDSITFNVSASNPQIVAQPAGSISCVGETINLTCNVVGPSFSLRWHKGGTALSDLNNISGSQSNTLSLSNASLNDQGWYRCEVIGNCSPFQYSDSVFVKINNCVSIENLSVNNVFSVFPNPTDKLLHLELNTRSINNGEISLYNLLGEKLTTIAITDEPSYTFDLTQLKNGVYLVVLKSEGNTSALKIIKQD